jgi:hypothetical protein
LLCLDLVNKCWVINTRHNVYTGGADVDLSRCTQCGKLNEPIEF